MMAYAIINHSVLIPYVLHPDTLFFVIASTDKNQPIGFVQVTDVNKRSGWGYLGICLIPSQQAKGLGSEVLNLLENYLIQVTGHRPHSERMLRAKGFIQRRRVVAGVGRMGFAAGTELGSDTDE